MVSKHQTKQTYKALAVQIQRLQQTGSRPSLLHNPRVYRLHQLSTRISKRFDTVGYSVEPLKTLYQTAISLYQPNGKGRGNRKCNAHICCPVFVRTTKNICRGTTILYYRASSRIAANEATGMQRKQTSLALFLSNLYQQYTEVQSYRIV